MECGGKRSATPLSLVHKSGIGLPHSKTSRKERLAIVRDSVLECGSPMPL
jgi:hypothetical protein